MDVSLEQKTALQATQANPASGERKVIWLLCLLSAVHVFIFSAVFPLFNINDEAAHYDLVLKYSHGEPPRGYDPMSEEWMRYFALFGTQEYFFPPEYFPDNKMPQPLWLQPLEEVKSTLVTRERVWRTPNHESSQPPLYYLLAGGWWRLGEWCGFQDAYLLYWVRFLDVLLVAALVWLGYGAARLVFPERPFVRAGVAALLAVMPQTVFYSVTNDILSPLTFGLVFASLISWWRADVPRVGHGLALGLALAATFLTKLCNLPLIGMAGLFLLFEASRLLQEKKWRASLPAWLCLGFSAVVPMAWWVWRCKRDFGDYTGSEGKVQLLGWTHKPMADWFHHPIFGPHGVWTFCHDLLASFWRGEFLWHRQPLASPGVDAIYVFVSLGLIVTALANLCLRPSAVTNLERRTLWFCFGTVLASAVFLGFLSIIYDYHDCFYPSREHPYFTSGRLMLGALIPFLLLCVHGLDEALNSTKNRLIRMLVLGGLMLFMLVAETAVDWPVFFSPYNWFHLHG